MKLVSLVAAALACAAGTALADPIIIYPAPAPRCALGVAIELRPSGTWIGTDGGARCFVPRVRGVLDPRALATELDAAIGPCTAAIELAAIGGTSYADIVAAMDLAVARTSDLGFGATAITFPTTAAASHCRAPVPPAASGEPARPQPRPRGIALTSPKAPPALADHTPVVFATATAVELGTGGARTSIAPLADVARGAPSAPIAALDQALPHVAHGIAILQADRATDAVVIVRVATTLRAAGYDALLFAVKNTP